MTEEAFRFLERQRVEDQSNDKDGERHRWKLKEQGKWNEKNNNKTEPEERIRGKKQK